MLGNHLSNTIFHCYFIVLENPPAPLFSKVASYFVLVIAEQLRSLPGSGSLSQLSFSMNCIAKLKQSYFYIQTPPSPYARYLSTNVS